MIDEKQKAETVQWVTQQRQHEAQMKELRGKSKDELLEEIAVLKAKIDLAKAELLKGLHGHTGFSLTRQQTAYLRTQVEEALKRFQ